MRFTDPNTICQCHDLIVPYGWSGSLNDIHRKTRLGVDDLSPVTVINKVGSSLFQFDSTPWIWRPPIEYVKISIDSPLKEGDVVVYSDMEGIEPKCVNNTSFDGFRSKSCGALFCGSHYQGSVLGNLIPTHNLFLFRRQPKSLDTIICDESLPLFQNDIITKSDIIGDPFLINNTWVGGFKTGAHNGAVNKTESVVSLTAARTIFSLSPDYKYIAWRRTPNSKWHQVSGCAQHGDVITCKEGINLDLVNTNYSPSFKGLGSLKVDGSNVFGASIDEIERFFNIKIKLWRNSILSTPQTPKRRASVGNNRYSQPLPIP